MQEEIVLEIHDLMVSYHSHPVLWNIDFSIPKGKMVGIIGPNGAGKSTLIKSIMNLTEKQNGYIKIFNQDLEKVRNRISYVPQRESVDWNFPVTVMDVVLMGRYSYSPFYKSYSKKDKEIACEALKKVDMLDFAKRHISQLSGGQQQRVFIARSLAQEADLFLLDEPFAGVDASAESVILNLLKQLQNEGKTIIVVHHDLQSAYEYFDYVVLLNSRLIAAGETELTFTPELLQKTYGGKLSLLDSLSNFIKNEKLSLK